MSKAVKIDPHLFETGKQAKAKTRRSKKETLQMINTGNEITDLEQITNTPELPLKPILKNASKPTASFGKKNGTVRIFIKDKEAYSKIEADKKKLAKHSIAQVRNYLRTRKLYTVGSSAPDTLLREIYEDAHLTGAVENTNSSTLIHNFLNEEP